MCVSPPSRPFVNWRIVSQLHPSPISHHPCLKMCISTQSRSHLNPIQVSRFVSPLRPGPQIHVFFCLSWLSPQSLSWYLHLTNIQVPSHLQPGPPNCILVPSKHHLKPIQVSRCVSHLHPGPFSTGELYLSSILVPYHHIHVSRCASQLNPGPISTPSRSRDLCLLSTQAPRCTFLLCLSWLFYLPQSGSWYLHLTYIQVTSHLHPSPPNCILVPSKHHLKPIQVSRCVSHLHPCPSSTGSRSQVYVLTTSMYCLTSIQVHRFPSHLHPGRVSPPGADIRDSLILADWNRKFITFCKGLNCASIT